MSSYDFSGWATRNDIVCSDGRIIRKDAFRDNDGKTVPLVWNHQHNEPFNVLGHALLENRNDGVYAYCKFNDTESGRNAKLIVEHGDVCSLSIYANQIKQLKNGNVVHGMIREVSLVLAGANPGAFIESVVSHSEDCSDGEAVIYTGEKLELHHFNEETQNLDEKFEIHHSDEGKDEKMDENKTIEQIFNTLTEEQKTAVYAIVGQLVEDDDDEEVDESMKHNIFDQDDDGYYGYDDALMHTAMEEIIADGKRFGSLKESFLAHSQDYGIENIDYLFPDDRMISDVPGFIQRDTGWINSFMGKVHHTPFSKVKSMFANITEDDARAKGYIKGHRKKEEFFALIKRSTSPTTVYKKQKMDRDDVIDITDFDVVAWLKSEMRMMLDEEIARAALVGDGRISSSDEKIDEQCIRPIALDDDLYTIKVQVETPSNATDDEKAKQFIRLVIKSRKEYKGSGEPTLFTTEEMLTNCLLLEDKNGRLIYDSASKLASVLRVKEIVTVPVMEGTRGKGGGDLLGIVVNPIDYNMGADKGGAVNMFDDFDIDYNAQKYLIETRCSGALIRPYSAIAFESATASSPTV